MPIWEKVGKSVLFADDGCTLISGKHMEDLNSKISEACIAKCDWYASAGFVINGGKSELMGIGCIPNPITVAGCAVKHKDSIKFLGLTISSDIKWNGEMKTESIWWDFMLKEICSWQTNISTGIRGGEQKGLENNRSH